MGQGYVHLSLDERVAIEKGLDAGESMASIARTLGRPTCTVSREVRRNRWRPVNTSTAYTPYRGRLRPGPVTSLQYRASIAQDRACQRAARSHQPHKMLYDKLVDHVVDSLRRGWTPQMIAGHLPHSHPGDQTMRACHETLYAWIYSKTQAWRELWQYLPRGQKKRKRRSGRKVHSSKIPFRQSIHRRPSEVDDRQQPGHWEGDSVLGLKSEGDGIHTQVERSTRLMIARKVCAITSQAALDAQLAIFTPLPAHMARSTTSDNGTEFHLQYKLADTLAMAVYHADPYSSYQRGTNEHHNGRLRRYLPKGTSFKDLTQQELDEIVNEINNQPRRVLGWHTPNEVFHQLNSTQHTTVALPT